MFLAFECNHIWPRTRFVKCNAKNHASTQDAQYKSLGRSLKTYKISDLGFFDFLDTKTNPNHKFLNRKLNHKFLNFSLGSCLAGYKNTHNNSEC